MRIGAFEIKEGLPRLEKPEVLAILKPWIDVGNVGTVVLSRLEARFDAREMGKLARPGNFFDFTRYRPTLYIKEGVRQLDIPNALITYAKVKEGKDFIFLHLLEPHMLGEVYANSILRLLESFDAQRYFLLGSMYDMVPHTRPLLVTGGGGAKKINENLERAGVQSSNYEGPTTITYLHAQGAAALGIETMTLIVHLPQYAPFEENYSGVARLIEILSLLYDISVDKKDMERAEEQRHEIDTAVNRDPKLKTFVAQLEAYYDERTAKREEDKRHLSPEVEGFLKEIEKRFRQN